MSLTRAAASAEVAPLSRPGSEIEAVTLPPYAVMLHNDDVNSMNHVVASLVACVPELAPEEAVAVMLEAHNNDVARVLVCPLERAELYRDRLVGRGLTATVERA